MSQVHRRVAAQAEEQEKVRRIEEEVKQEKYQREIDRRVTWALEEEERQRRILVDAVKDSQESIARELHRYTFLHFSFICCCCCPFSI